ncbi:MAG: HDOD domain-containing protein [Methylococcaceae bacterium]|nr:HDOD domain-containing protein [Methylococcaceae bacterium]
MPTAAAVLLSRIDPANIPTIPRVLLDLMNAVQRPDANMSELAKIIGQDASLSSKVLAAANSPFYSQFGQISDLNRVLVVLGLSTVKTIAITRAVQQFFSSLPQTQQNLVELIWYRSLSCAHLARSLAMLTAYDQPDEAYLAGLLHRLGQLILLSGFPKEYPEFLLTHFDGQHHQEKEQFGVFHNEIAAQLIASWKLQSFIADAVLYQHHSQAAVADSAKLVKIIHLASQLSAINSSNKTTALVQAGELFNLNQALLEDMLTDIKPLMERTAGSLGISISDPEKGTIKNLTTSVQRQAVNKLLGENIKNFALSAAVQQQLQVTSEVSSVVGIIQRDLQLLFGFPAGAIFSYNADNETLDGISVNDQQHVNLWPTLSININSGQSLLAQAFLEKQQKTTFPIGSDASTPLVDQQICRLFGTEGLLVIPLITEQRSVGVLVVGLDQNAFERLKASADYIALFAHEAAVAVSAALSSIAPSEPVAVADLRSDYELHTRKMSHEISNPLSIISNYLYLLGQRLGNDNATEIKLIQEEIDRVGKILIRLTDAPDSDNKEDYGLVDVNGLIVDLVKLFQVGLFKSNNINISLTLDYSLPEISSSRNKLKQILINLLKNASEAMPSGGNICVSTKDRIYLGKNCYAEIQVQDSGPGIPDAIAKQLFVPVYSNKGKNHQGLGLSISKNLIEELSGTLSCSSMPDKGTSFKIFLPRTVETK